MVAGPTPVLNADGKHGVLATIRSHLGGVEAQRDLAVFVGDGPRLLRVECDLWRRGHVSHARRGPQEAEASRVGTGDVSARAGGDPAGLGPTPRREAASGSTTVRSGGRRENSNTLDV